MADTDNDVDAETRKRSVIVGIAGTLLAGGIVGLVFWPRRVEAMSMPQIPNRVTVRMPTTEIYSVVRKWAEIFPRVKPVWILGVASIESNMRPSAHNDTGGDALRGGAFGLMQVTMETAQEVAAKLKSSPLGVIQNGLSKFEGPESLFDLDLNIMLGTAFLSDLVWRFKDDIDLAVAAYKWGVRGVQKMAAQGQVISELPRVVEFHNRVQLFEGAANDV